MARDISWLMVCCLAVETNGDVITVVTAPVKPNMQEQPFRNVDKSWLDQNRARSD